MDTFSMTSLSENNGNYEISTVTNHDFLRQIENFDENILTMAVFRVR